MRRTYLDVYEEGEGLGVVGGLLRDLELRRAVGVVEGLGPDVGGGGGDGAVVGSGTDDPAL